MSFSRRDEILTVNSETSSLKRETKSPTFTIGVDDFLLHGKPFQIISGALHYFRVHPDLWADRIHKARLMGLNTIETYVPWNQHAPQRGVFDTTAGLDLARFLRLVSEEGMHAIIRPGPYICAEWDNGGLPAWLTADPDVRIRRFEPKYLTAVREYFEQLLPIISVAQIDRGGPVILFQIENEYGAYGADKPYLQALVAMAHDLGITVPLTTVDQPTDQMLDDGSLPELHRTASFGSRSNERLATLRRHQTTGPLMCSEFWDGWFDHWGEHHHTTPVADAALELDSMLAAGASVNIYMFHGGTNFGFSNGANDKGTYKSQVTSYDYDAPLDEAGYPTEKYHAFREVIGRYSQLPACVPASATDAPAFQTPFQITVPLTDVREKLGRWRAFEHAPTMDHTEQYRGLCVYRTTLHHSADNIARSGTLRLAEIRDRALVSIDGTSVGALNRDNRERAIALPAGDILELLVEDLGRVSYGPRIGEPKGIIGPITLNGEELVHWEVLSLDLTSIDGSLFAGIPTLNSDPMGPSFSKTEFTLSASTDLFLDTSEWGKGIAWINGFNLGRYWSRGPQSTLYIPRSELRTGINELIILELHAHAQSTARFLPRPSLGNTDY
ncbi:beta-galactosidase [Cryobacterium sp. 10I1]|uniref:glycoside hydrolase family 35 protein n=1 Tax=unclassified Cryobacterium TaxID=2649013 RepID=UPI002AB44D41|nr:MULTISPECIES: beta-galactosidase family protein [unclassified Cryobacterium]MDY7544420.1 beta-galactosidase [Cryobacterium sp. 5B3]MEB0267492.1 beta-galactosidase [Cryobacterium sp. 10I5]MEB0275511.1 beta-galactosidase [Cryobacterium sp. 5B3]MEB0288168.1 beta-galactosidase [Cryobacterium sp. 10S3]MEB0303899.1 beta-galactosidase [Cryobacterium sp. 10I1]